MPKFRWKPTSWGIFGKITLYVFMITALVILAATVFSIHRFSEILMQNERENMASALEEFADYISEKSALMRNQISAMSASGHISSILTRCSRNPDQYHDYANIQFILGYLETIIRTDGSILDAVLITPANSYSYAKSNRGNSVVLTSFDFTSLPYWKHFVDYPGTGAFFDEHPPYISNGGEPVISFLGKLYISTEGRYQPYAYLMINYSPDAFRAAHKRYLSWDMMDFMVVNSFDEVIYSSDPAHYGEPFSLEAISESKGFLYQKVGNTGLQVAGSFSSAVTSPTVKQVIHIMIPIFAVGTVLILLVIVSFYRIYRKRIFMVTNKMLTVDIANLTDRLPVNSSDEIGKLSLAFNRMLETLDRTIQLQYKAEISRRTSEIHALQAQIHPHFLFNTIESIRMQALLEGNESVAEMLSKLGNMFRWMMQYEKQFVYLEDEVEYVTSYLYLQSLRFQDRMDSQIQIDDELMYLGIPKFTLQPIVENALRHGLQATDHLFIRVQGRVENEMLKIIVRDNSGGIAADKLEQLRKHISGEGELHEFGIGLKNVNMRLTMLFGEACGLTIECPDPGGTQVTITLPAMDKKEMEKYVSSDRG